MFWDDIRLVTEMVGKYGARKPFADLGGMARPCIADYELTIESGVQNDRFLMLNQRPFDHIDPEYRILNPENGDPFIEDLPYLHRDSFGMAVCLNVLEHVQNPFRVFAALYQIMSGDSLLILSTVFAFPYHPSPMDYWRFSPEALKYLAQTAGFDILECDWRLDIAADKGIRDLQRQEPQQIRSVYIVASKGNFRPCPSEGLILPPRFHIDGKPC